MPSFESMSHPCTRCGHLTCKSYAIQGHTVYLCGECEPKYVRALETLYDEFFGSVTVAEGVKLMLSGFHERYGIDLSNPHLQETPDRVSRMYMELLNGYKVVDPSVHLSVKYPAYSQSLIKVQDIQFNSLCIHHLAVISGTAHIGYVPNEYIAGLSKFGRVVDAFAHRLQLQELMTEQIIECIDRSLSPLGVMVVIRARHDCMSIRGSRKTDSITTTDAVRGIFLTNDAGVKDEFLTLLSADSRFST